MFASIGRFSYRYRRVIVAVWIVAFAAGLVATFRLPPELKGGGFTNERAPAQRALTLMQQRLHTGLSTISVVFVDPSLDARSPRFQKLEAMALSRVTRKRFPGLQSVQTFASTRNANLVSADGHATIAEIVFDTQLEAAQTQVPRLRRALRHTSLTHYVTGEPAVYADLENLSAEDLRRAETYALPLALVVLILVFGSVVAAALPIVAGGLAVSVTLGAAYLLAHVTDLSIFVMNTASMLGLAVGIDYSLLVVSRFREELRTGKTVAGAVEATVDHAGRAIFFSGIAVVIGLVGLLAFQYMSLRSIGIGGAVVVFLGVAAALTLLPALLGMLGPRVDSLRLFHSRGDGRMWQRWSNVVMAHPWIGLFVSLAIIALFTVPFLHIKVNVPTATSLPTSQEARKGYDIMQARFNRGALNPVYVLVTFKGDPFARKNLAALYAYGRRLKHLQGQRGVTSIVNRRGLKSLDQVQAFWAGVRAPAGAGAGGAGTSAGGQTSAGPGAAGGAGQATPRPSPTAAAPAGSGQTASGAGGPLPAPGNAPAAGARPTGPTVAPAQRAAARRLAATTTTRGAVLFTVAPSGDPNSTEAQQLSVRIVDLATPPGLRSHIAGLSAGVHDFLTSLYSRFPWVILYILVVTGAVLFVLLRSVVLPVKAVVVNVLSILSSFGALVFIFQDGHFQNVLGFTSTGTVDATLPILMFCTIFGVSMDYEVFLLTRMRERWLETGDNRDAVGYGLARTGRVITSAALIIVIVAGSFAFTSILITKAIGVGLAVAIALDATVVRVLLVPATMRILGQVNWWAPRWLHALLPGERSGRPGAEAAE